MSLAICIIAHDRKRDKLEEVYRSVLWQRPDELVIVADSPGEPWFKGHRWVVVPPATHTTLDALAKRDVGYLTTQSDSVCFLADDHLLAPQFVDNFQKTYEARGDWDILVPSRYCMRGEEMVWLNVGEHHSYAGGHCAVFSRRCAFVHPFSATARHRLWDLIHSAELVGKGARLKYADHDLAIMDNEPEAQPWR